MISKILAIKFRVRNILCYLLYILCVINGIVFLYKILFDIQSVTSLYQLGVPFNLALYSGIIGIMCETRPLNTEEQRRYNKNIMNLCFNTFILLSIINAIAIVSSMPVK